MNDDQIIETVSEAAANLPVKTLVVAFVAGAATAAATSGATYLVRRYIKARQAALENQSNAVPVPTIVQ